MTVSAVVRNPTAEAQFLTQDWKDNPRWKNCIRPYTAEEVLELRGSLKESYTIAEKASQRLWHLVNGGAKNGYVSALGALSGGQAVQMVKAGLEAVYLSGWQVAADNNSASSMYPDQSLYPVDSVPRLIKAINNTMRSADKIQWARGIRPGDKGYIDHFAPILADAEAGFGGVLNAYELTRQMIEAGVGGIHLEDQLSSAKKCGHLGGKVLVPTREAIDKIIAARLAADVMGVSTIIVARTDAEGASLLTSDFDERDRPFCSGERTTDGFYVTKAGIDQAIARGLAYAPYADIVWCETSEPCLANAKKFADAILSKFPGKRLAYNCSPSFNWKKNLGADALVTYQDDLAKLGYQFQFITLAGIHSMWFNTFDLAKEYAKGEGMRVYVEKVQEPEFDMQRHGYTFVAHQQEVGVSYFDKVANVIQRGEGSTCAMAGSTEENQF